MCLCRLPAAAVGAVVAQTEGRALGLVRLAHVGPGAAHLDAVQGTMMLAMVSTAVHGALDALVNGIHKNLPPFRVRP